MIATTERTITNRQEFIDVLDRYLISVCDMGYDDLPDTLFIDDYFYPGAGMRDIKDCAWEILDNAGYPRDLLNESVYGTDRYGDPLEEGE